MADFIDSVIEELEAGRTVALATVVGPEAAPLRMLGRKLVIAHHEMAEGTLGSDSLDRRVAVDAAAMLREPSTPKLVAYPLSKEEQQQLDITLPELKLFLETLVPSPTLLIAGGGHIALPLCSIGKTLGFSVAVVDDRPDFANKERFPEADKVISGNFGQVLRSFPINSGTYVVIVTRGHSNDEEALRAVIDSNAAYVGMIGSSRKVKTIMGNLRESGIPEEQLDRVFSPIGLDIAAETPAEIALGILAEIVHLRRRGTAHPSSMTFGNKKR
ncbi:MAG: XdhC family protein [Chloroflexota bacterium]|jgi:xanthine dehydrogenase accessory factor